MLLFNCHIEIGELVFPYVHSLSIESTWKNLTNTALIRLPRNLRLQEEAVKELIKVGDKVLIQLGYDGDLTTEFEGYVTDDLGPNTPLEVRCEDNMWKLKQTNITKAWEKTDLQTVIKEIVPAEFDTDVADVSLGSFKINNASAAKVLKEIKSTYGLPAYFKGNTLVVGKTYTDDDQVVEYDFQRNIIESDLIFRTAENTKIKVRAVSLLPDGSKIEAEVGDTDGEERTLHFYNLESQQELKDRAEDQLDKLKVDGYKGSFRTFGIPFAEHGFRANLTESKYPERAGSYFIDKVVTRVGVNEGFKRIIHPGPKAA